MTVIKNFYKIKIKKVVIIEMTNLNTNYLNHLTKYSLVVLSNLSSVWRDIFPLSTSSIL